MKILQIMLIVPFLLVGCSKNQAEQRVEEPMLAPTEDLGFSIMWKRTMVSGMILIHYMPSSTFRIT